MQDYSQSVSVINPEACSSVVFVCEHASRFIPPEYDGLGLEPDVARAHVAWDPGALAVAQVMSARMQAKLVASRVSRLVYDCNRPPSAPDAMPVKSEIFDIPGNIGLDAAAKAKRVAQVYEPFRAQLAQVVAETPDPILVTIHSFTPVYHGKPRPVEVGYLHDSDARLADALLLEDHGPLRIARNQPYGPEHGVTHTLKEHAVAKGHLNVMIEIRNDLIQTEAQQTAIGVTLSECLTAALDTIAQQEGRTCSA